MPDSLNIFDPYVRRARLQPALLVALPLALAFLCWIPSGPIGWGAVWSVIVWCGGTTLLSNVVRDQGKKCEPALFKAWGGKPTTQLLRHRGTRNAVILARRHWKLQEIIHDCILPKAEEEAADPEKADHIYDACTAFLLARTRDTKRYTLLFQENCSYGFRRNLWGVRLFGIWASAIGVALCAGALVHSLLVGQSMLVVSIICTTVTALLLATWVKVISPDWVRLVADSYAERLMETLDS